MRDDKFQQELPFFDYEDVDDSHHIDSDAIDAVRALLDEITKTEAIQKKEADIAETQQRAEDAARKKAFAIKQRQKRKRHGLLTLAVTLTCTFIPSITNAMTLRDSAVLRGIERLERYDYFGQRNNMIRLGNNVRTRRMSPRRILPQKTGTVTQVIDGSVLVVMLQNGEEVTVRTFGAEAPLIDTGSTKAQCFAEEAKMALENLVLGKDIALERDRNYHRDHHGRLLRYIRLQSMDVNGYMIWNGWSFAEDDNQHQRWDDYQNRETDARDFERGIWSNRCDYHPNPVTTFDVLQ